MQKERLHRNMPPQSDGGIDNNQESGTRKWGDGGRRSLEWASHRDTCQLGKEVENGGEQVSDVASSAAEALRMSRFELTDIGRRCNQAP